MLYVGTRGGPEAALVRDAGLPFIAVRTGKLRRYADWRNLTDPALVAAGVAQSIRIVRRFWPDVAFGAGGFATVPPLLAARVLGVPLVIHQQDVLPSLANRILVPFATRVTVAFPETVGLLRHANARIVGNPVRDAFAAASAVRAGETLGLESGVPLVLATGGGTGALNLNQIVASAAPQLIEGAQVLHLTGAGKRVEAIDHPRYRQVEFLTSEMPDVLAAAEVVITRAGMSALAEVGALGKAAIVIPMPNSHQEANAAVVARHQAGVVAHERELTPRLLVELVRELLADTSRRHALEKAASKLLPASAADAVVSELAQAAGELA
jgi:UDP-N-acetylglucosamine--N-acetylmuramyl-(pentapeptide) pyrophosphoryl-undecaprenol N-acetylglucosamine transferase